jgi:hypothetical protein
VSLLVATPAVIFWLWLVIVPVRVAILCPEECHCDTGGNLVFCSSTSLTAVPLIHLTDVRVLSLSENNITLFEKDSFVSLTELEELDINKFGLRTIELGTFNGLTKLTVLFIWDNEIGEIIPGTFDNLNSLEYLDLDNNSLEHVDSDLFNRLVNIKFIDLKVNKIQYLQPDMFLGLPNLQNLLVGYNPTLTIPTDRNFINSHSLSHLDISNCNVSSVSVETFANVSALEWLDLSNNDLRTVDINILRALPKLSTLYLYGNPLQCDCQLQELWRWCKDHNIRTAYEERKPECATPSEVGGMCWGVLEKGQCLEGKIQYYGDYNSTRYNYNDTDHKQFHKYDDDFFKLYQAPLFAVPFTFVTISNVILLIIIICNKDMRTIPNMYILNLAISDIIYITSFFSEACANRISNTWLSADIVCTFFPLCRRMSVGLTAYSIAVYSFQRYRVTVNPFQVRVSSQATWRFPVATICGIWTLAALFSVPTALSKYQCEGLFFSRITTYYQLVVIFELLVFCILPLCVVTFTYVMTAHHLVESSRSISEGTQNLQLNIRRNTAKVLVGLTVVFLISYVPYHVLMTYINSNEKEENFLLRKTTDFAYNSNYKLRYTYLFSRGFLVINSCLNPVALFCTSSPFRQHLKRYLTCFCKTNSPLIDLELRRRN